MRDILFRGKKDDMSDCVWIYGSLLIEEGRCFIRTENMIGSIGFGNEVFKESVGQFTGLLDKNGKKIFEGDKFDCDAFSDDFGSYYLIEWDNKLSKFSVNVYGNDISYGEGSQEIYDSEISRIDYNVIDVADLEDDFIIGNIHDNPELL